LQFSYECLHLKIASEFLPTHETNHYQGGHYACLVPMKDKWMGISGKFFQYITFTFYTLKELLIKKNL
jgi:hypothetical protein